MHHNTTRLVTLEEVLFGGGAVVRWGRGGGELLLHLPADHGLQLVQQSLTPTPHTAHLGALWLTVGLTHCGHALYRCRQVSR